ncbi:MAG: branched-chain amino acid ABC transporter permease [Deltaproteobacteria bacterium]|nr:branched-chain amino acid ABC transporter permease [Deltaproteobacteria bacterium]MBW2075346.1 branched-chain amino acid ABC transporter permease [Deltaproteobacteria bacterium]
MINLLQFSILGLLRGGLYSLIGITIVLVFKSSKVVSIAHGQLLAFGALFFWIFLEGWGCPFLISLLLAIILAGLMGYFSERFTMRPLIGQPLFTSFLMTFALFMFLDGAFQLYLAGQTRAYPPFLPQGAWNFSGVIVPKGQFVSFLISLLLFFILALFFKYTKAGLGMRATAEDHRLAQSAGVSVRNIFTFIWIISSMVAAISGIALASVTDIYYPLPYYGIKGLIVALFGGMESIGGALLAGLLLGLFENISAGYLDPVLGGGVKDMASYVMLLVILLVKPHGLFGLARIERL